MKKTLGFLTAALVIITSLSACGGEKVLYATDKLTVTQAGRTLIVDDLETGGRFTFKTVRVLGEKSSTNGRTLVRTSTLTISTAGGCLIIQPKHGETVIIAKSGIFGR